MQIVYKYSVKGGSDIRPNLHLIDKLNVIQAGEYSAALTWTDIFYFAVSMGIALTVFLEAKVSFGLL